MKTVFKSIRGIAFAVALLAGMAVKGTPAVTPMPESMAVNEGSCIIPASVKVCKGKGVSSDVVSYFRDALPGAKFSSGSDKAAWLRLECDKNMPDEAYTLTVAPSGVVAKASAPKGFFYAAQTLEQLASQADGAMECVEISDKPRFGYRGFMIDVVRCYQPYDSLKKLIDMAAHLKLNNVHLHLTDDNGWRLEIKKYPELTRTGAWRVDREEIFPARPNPKEGEPATYGGYYTQKQMRDLVKYAAARHVNIIPEIEMPAHAVAALASYPNLACPVSDEFFGVTCGIGGNNAQIIACAGNDDTFRFYEDVLTEVMDIFPSKMIHLGGDEANKTRWEKCPLCNKRMEEEGIADYEQLQGYFMDRINNFVRSKGRTAIGWDEVTYGNPKEDMVIMGWQGDGGVAVRYAQASGRRFIMTPAKSMYLIRYQGPQWFEPMTYFGNVTLKDVYSYEPVKDNWSETLKSQLMGIQASMWTEFCRTPSDVQYMVFPRLVAAADAAWRPEGKSDWPMFLQALDNMQPRMQRAGVTASRAMYNIDHKVVANGKGKLSVELSSIRPDVEIRVSDVPSMAGSRKYTEPVTLETPRTIYAATFRNGVQMGKTLTLPVGFNYATGCEVKSSNCKNGLQARLTNGVRASDRNSDFEWAGWHNDVAQFEVDLGEKQHISSVVVGNLANINLCIAAPKALFLYTSDNGSVWDPAGEIYPDDTQIYPPVSTITDFDFGKLNANGRYLKIVAVNPGAVPQGMPREGTATWLYFDEIIVK